jgi:hypothetical protein
MPATSGCVEILNGDGEAGIAIFEGASPTIQPIRIFNGSGTLLFAVGVNGGASTSAYAEGVQSVTTTPVVLNALNGLILVDATAGAITLTLPAAGAASPFGLCKTIVKTDSSVNTVTINRAGADTIGANSYTTIQLTTQGASVRLESNGVSVWHIIPESFSSFASQIRSVAGTSYNAVPSDYAVEVDATAGAYTFNLPAANSVPRGWQIKIKKIDAGGNAVTVTRAGADTIEGATTAALAAQWNSVNLTSDGVSLWLKF